MTVELKFSCHHLEYHAMIRNGAFRTVEVPPVTVDSTLAVAVVVVDP